MNRSLLMSYECLSCTNALLFSLNVTLLHKSLYIFIVKTFLQWAVTSEMNIIIITGSRLKGLNKPFFSSRSFYFCRFLYQSHNRGMLTFRGEHKDICRYKPSWYHNTDEDGRSNGTIEEPSISELPSTIGTVSMHHIPSCLWERTDL